MRSSARTQLTAKNDPVLAKLWDNPVDARVWDNFEEEETIMDILRGIKVPAGWVGTARGAVEAALMGGLVGLTVWLGEAKDLAVVAPAGFAAIRFLEGIVDQVDPLKKRAP